MSQDKEDRTYQDDGTRPIEHRHIEIAATFQDSGTRPIEESPDYLITETQADRDRALNEVNLDTDKEATIKE